MKKILFIIFLLSCFDAFSLAPVWIDAEGENKTFDLQGRSGFDGQDGKDAHLIDCNDGIIVQGRNGEDAQNGEKGEDGRDAIVFYADILDLKSLRINQSGGAGGAPGIGGLGAIGCNGGSPGDPGKDGLKGESGDFGRLFLVDKNIKFKEESNSRLLTLGDLKSQNVGFVKHYWTQHKGAKELFKKTSEIFDEFFEYDYTANYKLKFIWNSYLSFAKYADTRIALSLVDGELDLKSYRGAILDYKITKYGSTFFLEVFDANSEYELKNLSFGKVRGAGEDLTLEIKEKFKPIFMVETKFVMSLYSKHEAFSQDGFIGQFQIPAHLITKVKNKYILSIGKLNFPPEFKRKGSKIKTHFSIYRKARMQTRVLALKGIFRI